MITRPIIGTLASWAFAALLVCARHVGAQEVDQNLWGTDGVVNAVARDGNTIYVAGAFGSVGPNTGSGVPLDRGGGAALEAFPRVAGSVDAVIPDGVGGWYIGGAFVAVGGVPRTNLAHILQGGDVAAWAPNPDGEVLAMAHRGQTLVVGGYFRHVGGQARSYVAAVDLDTGRATNWDPEPDLQVRALLLTGGSLFVGGDFSSIGGEARRGAAEIDLATGRPSAWNPDLGGSIRALAVQGDTIYVGGAFGDIRAPRQTLAAVDAATGLLAAWNPRVTGANDVYYGDPYVSALLVRGNTIYAGGHFTGIGDQVRGGLAQVDLTTGRATAWNPDPGPWTGAWNRDITALAIADTTLYVAGMFENIGGQPRSYVAEVSVATGAATAWDPRPNDVTKALAVSANAVYVGGYFTGIGSLWQHRQGLAAFDVNTGAVKEWNPAPEGLFVSAIAVARGRVYAGGYFSFIGGKARSGFAALDTLGGGALDWAPTANGVVSSLLVAGDTLYAGGYFTSMSGATRDHLASFDLVTGGLTTWDPDANDDVYDLALKDSTLYVAGFFSAVGGIPRRFGAAAVDARSGTVRDWNPQSDNWVGALLVVGNTVVAGGSFTSIGGQPRTNLAALDAVTGEATPWMANTNSPVDALARMGDTLFVSGTFSEIGGQPRSGLAALDLTTGTPTAWNPDLSSVEWWSALTHPSVGALAFDNNTLYVGGWFGRVGDVPASHLAAISFGLAPPTPRPPPSALMLGPLVPNPAHTNTTICFVLPAEEAVSLAVFDLQGRRVASLLTNAARPAGINSVSLRVDGWREGFYFCRLEADGRIATHKFVVLK